jgi:hypothetical protein
MIDFSTGRHKRPAIAWFALVLGVFAPALFAQHAGHMEMPVMTSALFPGLSMAREGSGTSWQPDVSPVFAWHVPVGSWTVMIHGCAFLRYTDQDAGRAGTRGGRRVDAPNWVMIMAHPPHGGKGGFSLRGMFSLDPLTEGGHGYPLLFQTGESWQGEALVDRQHPHDLFSELSLSYGRSVGQDAGVFLYFGFPGEPALGPPAFMHRSSSQSNPDAPLGHHLQDSTHITFGVLTGGVRYKSVKIDASIFTGREPDEDRFGFDRPRFDSGSVRLSFNPSDRLAMQVSHGFLRSPEANRSEANIGRTTASLIMSQPLPAEAVWTTTLVWGMNASAREPATHSLLVDSEIFFKRASFYSRVEVVQRQAHDLKLDDLGDRILPIAALTAGATWKLRSGLDFQIHAGAQASLYHFSDVVAIEYGKGPFSFEIFFRLSPPRASLTEQMTH